MKKSTIIASIAFLFCMVFTTNINAQQFRGLDASPMDAAYFPGRSADKLVKIYYSRPQLKGRDLATLAPNGKVWRTGANENPEIIFYKDVKLGDNTIKAGTYSLFTIPGEKEWTIIINSDLNNWGSFAYKQENDVVRLNVPASTAEESLEAFSIAFEGVDNGVHMHLGWGNTRVAVPITK